MSDNVEIDGGGSTTVHRPVDEPVGTPSTATPVRPPAGPVRRLGFLRYTLPGSWTALIFACLSFTPSLLPRSGIIQGLVCGITAAIGYGLGVWGARSGARSPTATRGRRVRGPGGPSCWAAGSCSSSSSRSGSTGSTRSARSMGVTSVNVVLVVVSPLVAAVVFVLLVQLGRGLRALYRWLARQLRRWIGPRAANAVGWIVVAAVTYLVVSGVLLDGIVNAANETFSLRDTTTAEGVHQPTTDLRSGGPGSLIPWDTLGWQGRTFTGLGPTANDIETLTQPARQGPDPGVRRPGVGRRLRGARRPGGAGAGARGRLPAQEPARRDDDRQRLGQRRVRRHLRVPQRRRFGDRRDAVLLPAVVAVVPGGPVEGARGRPGSLRRRLRPLVEAAAGRPSPAVRRG